MSKTTSTSELLSPELLRRLERLELVSRKIFRGRMKGERRSRRKGLSVEFADFRNYVAGDDLRFLDWNLYARLDKLFLKLFLEEEDLHFHALLDASRSMDFGSPTKLHFAKQLAAALGFIGLIRADRVHLEILGSSRLAAGPVLRGRRNLPRLLEFLDGIAGGQNVALAEGVKNFCLRNSSEGIVVLLTDLMDKGGYEQALRLLLAQRLDIYVIQILAPEEFDPQLQGDLKLIDAEDADVVEVTVSRPLLDRYQRTLARFLASARDFCAHRGIVHMVANTMWPVDQLVTTYLRERGLVQ
jgi:uncharacterized protein (DUF58 family)